MRLIRYAILAVIGIGLLVVALANRGEVTLNLLPAELLSLVQGFVPGFINSVTLPLYIVIFGGLAGGLLLGFLWEWVREHKHRAEASRARKEAASLKREIKQVRKTDGTEADDVLAIVDGTR